LPFVLIPPIFGTAQWAVADRLAPDCQR